MLGFDIIFVIARITLTLISSFAMGSFQKVSFQGFNLCIKR